MGEAEYRRTETALWGSVRLSPSETRVGLARLGTSVRVQEVGEGEPVLFVHGSPAAGATWAVMLAELGGLRRIVVDNPGAGLSEPITLTPDTADDYYSYYVTDLMDALGLERAHVVASSLGGALALCAAGRDLARFASMVLMGGPWMAPGRAVPAAERLMLLPGAGAVLGRLPMPRSMMVASLRGIGHGASIDAGRIPEPWWAWNDALVRHTDTFGNDCRLVRAFRGSGLSYAPRWQITLDELARIEVPTLAVWGADDTDVDASTGRAMADALPHGRIEVLPGSGHLPWIDYPDQVANLVRGHVTST